MEKWDHKPNQLDDKSLNKLMREKPGATIGDAIHGVPSQELTSNETEYLQHEKDTLTLEIIKLQVELDKLNCITKPNEDTRKGIARLQRDLSDKKQLLLDIDTHLSRHGDI